MTPEQEIKKLKWQLFKDGVQLIFEIIICWGFYVAFRDDDTKHMLLVIFIFVLMGYLKLKSTKEVDGVNQDL